MTIFKKRCDRCGKEYDYTQQPIYIACKVDLETGIPEEMDLCGDCLTVLKNFCVNRPLRHEENDR